jgi:hypothetical protein
MAHKCSCWCCCAGVGGGTCTRLPWAVPRSSTWRPAALDPTKATALMSGWSRMRLTVGAAPCTASSAYTWIGSACPLHAPVAVPAVGRHKQYSVCQFCNDELVAQGSAQIVSPERDTCCAASGWRATPTQRNGNILILI